MTQAVTTATTDDAALQHLLTGPSTLQTSVSELARTWGWNRTKVRRRLDRWSAEGLIARAIEEDGRSTITLVAGTVNVAVMVPAPAPEATGVDAPLNVQASTPLFSVQAIIALALFALAIVVAYFGLRINAWYGASLARDAEASALLAGLSITGDAVALLLPTTAQLVRGRLEKISAWALWLVTLGIALMAAIGFASVNISDTGASRARTANETAQLTAQLTRLEGERAAIKVKPAAVQGLRNYRVEAARVDGLDAQIAATQTKLAALPAVTIADPQAEMAAHLLRWISGGIVNASSSDIAMLRIVGMTLLPQISGLVLMLGFGLWRQRR